VFGYAEQRGQQARLEVVLPMERNQYAQIQGFDAQSRAEFDQMLEAATFSLEPPPAALRTHEDRADAYVAAAEKLVARCDVLIALWDGKPAVGKRGGTAHTLLNAAARGKACVWIPIDESEDMHDNLEENSGQRFVKLVAARSEMEPDSEMGADAFDTWSLGSVSQELRLLDEYNRKPWSRLGPHRAGGPLGRIVLATFDSGFGRRVERDFHGRLQQSTETRLADGTPQWLAAPSARASLLADLYRRWFKRLSTLVLTCATLAAVVLGVGVATGGESPLWPVLEFVFLMLTLLAFLVLRKFGFHSRWLSYRVLAERFRIARYVAPTGIDFREQARLQRGWVEGGSDDWLMRAFEEIWDRDPHKPRDLDDELEQFKRLLAHDWIGGQIRYHDAAKTEHHRLKRRLTVTAFAAFGLTVVFAAVEAILIGLHVAERVQRVSKGLTIVLPVLAASVGAALTINQHHALAEHSTRMQADLRRVKADLEAATDTRSLTEATVAAARMIAPETGAWFAALWFLDMEHP